MDGLVSRTLLARLTHPVWWEDVIPGALMGLPRALRVFQGLLLGHPAL